MNTKFRGNNLSDLYKYLLTLVQQFGSLTTKSSKFKERIFKKKIILYKVKKRKLSKFCDLKSIPKISFIQIDK